MNVRDAREASHDSEGKIKKSIKCVWYCGLINEKIKKATEDGKYSITICYSPDHYVVKHHEIIQRIYENNGYNVSFKPDYMYIKATKWILIINW